MALFFRLAQVFCPGQWGNIENITSMPENETVCCLVLGSHRFGLYLLLANICIGEIKLWAALSVVIIDNTFLQMKRKKLEVLSRSGRGFFQGKNSLSSKRKLICQRHTQYSLWSIRCLSTVKLGMKIDLEQELGNFYPSSLETGYRVISVDGLIWSFNNSNKCACQIPHEV